MHHQLLRISSSLATYHNIGTRRTASIRVEGPPGSCVELAVVAREDFDAVVKSQLHDDMMRTVDILQQLHSIAFQLIPKMTLRRLALHFTLRQCAPHVVIFREGQPIGADHHPIYWILEGECRLLQTVKAYRRILCVLAFSSFAFIFLFFRIFCRFQSSLL